MDYQIKLFCRQSHRACLIIVARGLMDKEVSLRMFREVVELTKPFDDCKVLLDLQNAACDFKLDDLVEWKAELRAGPSPAVSKLKLAMVTTPPRTQSGRPHLRMLPVAQMGIEVAVFFEGCRAIEWLDIAA